MIADVIDLRSSADRARLAGYASGGNRPAPGFWTAKELASVRG
jgi:hypothetical protein